MYESKNTSINYVPKLTKSDKINTLDMLSWAAQGAAILSIWQIVIPFKLFTLNLPQMILGITSLIFLVISIIVLLWSNKGYEYLKRLKDNVNENPPLPGWHIEGAVYLTSFILIAVFIVSLVGIWIDEGYSWALLSAIGIPLEESKKEAHIIVFSQALLIIFDLIILAYYIKQSYHLEFTPVHLPTLLGWFLVFYISCCAFTLGDTNYVPPSEKYSETLLDEVKSAHSSMFWLCIVGILISMFFLIEQRSIQQDSNPKVKFYFLPFLLILLSNNMNISVSAMQFITSLDFAYAASRISTDLKKDCKGTLQQFSSELINRIGCPSKYKMTNIEGNTYYDQQCEASQQSLVWEIDVENDNANQINQVACVSLNCCYLISEDRSLNYKKYFLQCFLTSIIGVIAACHCFDLAMQSPHSIRAGPSYYSTGKYILQILIAFVAIFFGIYMLIQFEQKLPDAVPSVNIKKHIISRKPALDYNALAAIQTCKRTGYTSTTGNICITSQGVVQVLPNWQAPDVTLPYKVFDSYLLQNALHQKSQDTICLSGSTSSINDLLTTSLYICSNTGIDCLQLEPTWSIKESAKRKYKHLQTSSGTQNVTISVLNAHSQPLKDATIIVYSNLLKCREMNPLVNYAIKNLKTNTQGRQQLYNIILPVTVHVHADGYLSNCLTVEESGSYVISVPAVFTGVYRILLWNQESSSRVELGANSIQSRIVQCNVGYFNDECGYMRYTASGRLTSEITINQLTDLETIFYVRHVPSPEIRQVVFNRGLQLSPKEDKELIAEVKNILLSDPVVTIYDGNQYPLWTFTLPDDQSEIAWESVVWLVSCLKGEFSELGHFWQKSEKNQYWQRPSSSTQQIPDSSICDKFYANHQ